jgi:MFS family permease
MTSSPGTGGAFRARVAISAVFFINGAVFASWIAHIPSVKMRHDISDGALGLVLLSTAVGSVLALPMAGWLIARWGSRVMTSAAALGFCLMLPLPVISPNVALLALALALLGACNGALDVSMNAQAVALEERYPRPLMSSFHGLWSLGGVSGAAVASGAMALGVGSVGHVVGVMIASAAVVGLALRGLLPVAPRRESAAPVFVKPPRALLGLGLVTFCGLLAEGAVGDWSAVYLRDALGSAPAVAAAGFAAFSLMMAAGRFVGDRLSIVLGPPALLRASGATAAIGLGAALLVGKPWPAIIGFGLVGLGIANVIPVVFSAAGRVGGVAPATALAAVATTGYGGYLAGPPLIGLAAHLTSLPVALGILAAVCVVIAVSAKIPPRLPVQDKLQRARQHVDRAIAIAHCDHVPTMQRQIAGGGPLVAGTMGARCGSPGFRCCCCSHTSASTSPIL